MIHFRQKIGIFFLLLAISPFSMSILNGQEEVSESLSPEEQALIEAAEKAALKESEKLERELKFQEYISSVPKSNYFIPSGFGILSGVVSVPELLKLPEFNFDLFPAVNLFLNQELTGNIGLFSYGLAVDFHINFLGMGSTDDFYARHYNVMCFDFTWNDKKAIHFNIREAWVKFRVGLCSFTLGSKRINWGTGKVLSVLDIINARYIDTRFSHNRDDLWIGNLVFDFTVLFPKNWGYFQAIFIPFPTTNQRLESKHKIHVVPPPVSYTSFEGAMRFMFNLHPRFQTSLNLLTIMDRNPTDVVGWHHQDYTNDDFDPVYGYGRRYIAGLDCRFTAGFFTSNFEAAFVMTNDLFLPYQPSINYQPMTYSSTVEGVVEFNFNLAKEKAPTDITALAHIVFPLNVSLPSPPFVFPVMADPILGVRFSGQYYNTQSIKGMFRPEIQFLMSIAYFDFEASASLGICFLPTIELRFGANITASFDPQYYFRYLGPFYKKGGDGFVDDVSTIFIEFKMWY